jgi:hypothetical protein
MFFYIKKKQIFGMRHYITSLLTSVLFVFVSAAGQYSSLLHTLILRTNETLELIPHDLVLF